MKTKGLRIEIKNKEGAVLLKRELNQFPIIIGRKAPADIVVENVFISNSHCRISRIGDKFLFEDLNSTNGSFVGRRKIENFEIDDLAQIRIGTEISIRFSIPVFELEVEEKTRVAIPETTRDQILVRQPQQFTLMEHQYRPLQFFRDLDHFLLPYMDQSYKSFITFYFMTGILFSALFLVTIESIALGPAVIQISTYLSIVFAVLIVPAGVLSLPGWAIKRQSSFKKIYFSLIMGFTFFAIQKNILLPFSLSPTTGPVIQILCHAFNLLGVFLVGYMILESLLNKKWTHRCASALIAIMVVVLALTFGGKKNSDQSYLQKIYEASGVGLLSWVPVPEQSVDDATAALLEFDKNQRAPSSK